MKLIPNSRADLVLTCLLALGGLCAVGYGLWSIFPPLAWIFLGSVALHVSRAPAPPAEPKAAEQ